MKAIDTLKTIRQETKNILNDLQKKSFTDNDQEKKIIKEVYKQGFSIVPHYYSPETCEKLRAEIDSLIEKYSDRIFIDKEKSDHRVFGADKLSPLISEFLHDNFVQRIIETCENTQNISGLTLAAKLVYQPGNHGSGDGWHRDTAHSKQVKALIYLSDVSVENGPFQYIIGSHKSWKVLKDGIVGNFQFNQNRFTDEEIERLGYQNDKLYTATAKAGTLIITNTRGLHRGMPIKKGTRYALTNYYWVGPFPQKMLDLMVKNENSDKA